MERHKKIALKEKVNQIVEFEKKYNNDDVEIVEVVPLSSDIAAVVGYRASNGQRFLDVLIWAESIKQGSWWNISVSYPHIVGFGKLTKILQEVEEFNFNTSPYT